MKKWYISLLVAVLLLCGCSPEETPVFETVDGAACSQAEKPAAGTIQIQIPEGATAEAMAEDGDGELYTWEGNALQLQTMDGGDIRRTVEQLTGMEYEDLTVMCYTKEGMTYYRTVWSAAGEEGLLLGRAVIADDGAYHYCVSLLSPEDQDTGAYYDQICASFGVTRGGGEK